MADENKLNLARTTFRALCEMLDDMHWYYEKDEKNLKIMCGAQGDDLPMALCVSVDTDRKLVMLLSDMPFNIPENKRKAMAVAVSAANLGLPDGSFDYDYRDGRILFRLTSSYMESLISKTVFEYMLLWSTSVIDNYNDKFLAVSKSDMSYEEIWEFIE